MKRTLLIFALTLVLVFGALPLLDTPVSAATSGTTGSCTWSISGTTLTISGNGPMANYSDENLPPWIESAPSISTIHVKEGVTSIGDYAFLYCSASSVLIPNYSLTRIGDGAFLMCTNITSFWMPHTVTNLGTAVFGGCYKLQSLSISTENPVYTSAGNCIMERATGRLVAGCGTARMSQLSGLRAIGEGAFMYVAVNGTGSGVIPEGATTIETGAFAYSEIGSLSMPSTLTTIGEGAFMGADLGTVSIPEGIKAIPAFCFYQSLLRGINLPSTLESIGDYAFSYCEKLGGVTLPQNLKYIGDNAFWACSLHGTLQIPATVEHIGISAFSANENLAGITVAEGNPYYKAVNNCLIEKASGTVITGCSKSILPEGEGIRCIGDYAFAYSNIKNVVLPKGVTTVGEGAFCGCESLKYVYLPAGVTYVEAYAFCDIPYIESLSLQKNSPNFHQNSFDNTIVGGVWVEGTPPEAGGVTVPLLASSTWHYVDNYCTTTCALCGANRPDPNAGHKYNNTCDPDCNRCGEKRETSHQYYNACDANCNKCGEIRSVPDHVYSSLCDETCDVCNNSRSTSAAHDFPYECSAECPLCGKNRNRFHVTTRPQTTHTVQNDESFPYELTSDGWYQSTNTQKGSSSILTVVGTHHCTNFSISYQVIGEPNNSGLKILHSNNASTIVPDGETGAQTKTFGFWNTNRLQIVFTKTADENSYVRFKFGCNCSPTVTSKSDILSATCAEAIVCDHCGTTVKEQLPHTYDSVCDAECNSCAFVRTAPHDYDNACDPTCGSCGETRQVPDHVYDNVCDAECNECGETRSAGHLYDNDCDEECNLCSTPRRAPHVYDNSADLVCNECGSERPPYVPGDLDGEEGVTLNDAIYLLYHVNFPALYPVDQPVDFDSSGEVDLNDAIYLLYHVNFPSLYPLH